MVIQVAPHTLKRAEERGTNKRLSDDVVLDIGDDDKIVGIEILDASKRLNLGELLPVKYSVSPEAAV